ncbi:MAG: hypothetical protein K0Q87_2559 [Neobacillus sp.]|jgi:hypothetical protein|nr:hypothetical protein [Neobacillus sp.]
MKRVFTTLMWVVPREDTYNPLVPFWDEGFFYFFIGGTDNEFRSSAYREEMAKDMGRR